MKNMTNEQITEYIKTFLVQVYNEKGFDEYIKTHEAILAGDFQAGNVVCPVPSWANKFVGQFARITQCTNIYLVYKKNK